MPEYDVFISYNRQDVQAVHHVANNLKRRSLRVFLDETAIIPGDWFQDTITKGIKESGSIAIFVGPGGLGPWETPELRLAMDRRVKEQIPVIPVILPGVIDRGAGMKIEQVLPGLLGQLRAVEFQADLDDRDAMDRLVWGITRRNPMADIPALPATDQPIAVASDVNSDVKSVVDAISGGDAVFLVGRMAAGAKNPEAPGPSEVSARLLRDLDLVQDNYTGFVPGVECVASLVVAAKGEPGLQRLLNKILSGSGALNPGTHDALADLVKQLGFRPVERRARRRAPRLIISTGFDLLMERALLRAGVSFTRLVQFRSEPRIDVTVFDPVAIDVTNRILFNGRLIAPDKTSDIDDAIYAVQTKPVRYDPKSSREENPLEALAIGEYPEPILYKFQGSQDIDNSCAISADQCFEFTWHMLKQNCVPSQVTELVGNSTLIAVGSSVLDQDFRLIFHTLLRKPLELNNNPRYSIVSRQDVDDRDASHQMSRREWKAIEKIALLNYKLTTIDAPAAEFLRTVSTRLKEMWRDPGD